MPLEERRVDELRQDYICEPHLLTETETVECGIQADMMERGAQTREGGAIHTLIVCFGLLNLRTDIVPRHC